MSSLPAALFMTNEAVRRESTTASSTSQWSATTQRPVRNEAVYGEPDYRELKRQFEYAGRGNWVLMPPYPYSPNESMLDLAELAAQSSLARRISSARTIVAATSSCGSPMGSTSRMTFALLVTHLLRRRSGPLSEPCSAISAASSTSSANGSSRSGRRCRSSTPSSSSAPSLCRYSFPDEPACCSRRSGCWSSSWPSSNG